MENRVRRENRRAALVAAALMLAACGQEAGPTEPPPNQAQAAAPSAASPATPATPAATAEPPAATPAPAAPSPWSPSGYRLIGTEPFWGGTVTADAVVYSTPENEAGERVAVSARYAEAQEVYAGALDGQRFILTLTPGPCSDGMSDNVHAFTAVLEVKGETRNGCADPGPH